VNERRVVKIGNTTWSVFAVYPSRDASVSSNLASGWLCFETDRVVRRLAPIPNNWLTASESELASMAGRAEEPRDRSSIPGDPQTHPRERDGNAPTVSQDES
jgi:hypothetical protein